MSIYLIAFHIANIAYDFTPHAHAVVQFVDK